MWTLAFRPHNISQKRLSGIRTRKEQETHSCREQSIKGADVEQINVFKFLEIRVTNNLSQCSHTSITTKNAHKQETPVGNFTAAGAQGHCGSRVTTTAGGGEGRKRESKLSS
ncbi:hypothetical protein EYF80_028163 [Liparis tanakae]|uniref:Uncharacterized protein n=1 Tax=Liparis tanakae TaxID=230148 RepID=A0A4Z2H6V6_9TELE|nr:hypothetical protein EYF80_028163 [Liparis tanakae]